MRVISGTAKGRKLKMVPGDSTRPILDRVKESLFNILDAFIPGTRWLDLFAGTGQVGIEALSRGAAEVVFVDLALPAIKTIRSNLKHTRLEQGAQVVQANAFDYLKRVARGNIEQFDLIYVAPPQYKTLWQDIMYEIDRDPAAYLFEDGMVVVQIDPKEFEALELSRLELSDRRKYGRTILIFYEQIEQIENSA